MEGVSMSAGIPRLPRDGESRTNVPLDEHEQYTTRPGGWIGPVMPENPKEAMGQRKPPLGLIPPSASIEEARAFNYGAFEAPRSDGGFGYGPFNWRENPVKLMTYIHAMKRHIDDFLDGQHDAADSGVHHLGHVRACAAILIDAEACGTLIDDRPKPGKAAELLERYTVKS